MRALTILTLFLIISSCTEKEKISCRIETSVGNIDIELYPKKAPITVNNFLKYVENNLFDSCNFFRTCTPENEKDREIKIQVIQGGEISKEKCFEPIELETTNKTGIEHVNGTISMARADPNSATSQFFICIGDQPELNYNGKRNPDGLGFAAFGKVIKGMSIVKKIQQKDNLDQMLLEPIIIKKIRKLN